MKSSMPSENLIKLRELIEEIDTKIKTDDLNVIIKSLQEIIESGKAIIDDSKSLSTKIKYYESMYSAITKLLKTLD